MIIICVLTNQEMLSCLLKGSSTVGSPDQQACVTLSQHCMIDPISPVNYTPLYSQGHLYLNLGNKQNAVSI